MAKTEWHLVTTQDEMLYALITEQRKTNDLLEKLLKKQTKTAKTKKGEGADETV